MLCPKSLKGAFTFKQMLKSMFHPIVERKMFKWPFHFKDILADVIYSVAREIGSYRTNITHIYFLMYECSTE